MYVDHSIPSDYQGEYTPRGFKRLVDNAPDAWGIWLHPTEIFDLIIDGYYYAGSQDIPNYMNKIFDHAGNFTAAGYTETDLKFWCWYSGDYGVDYIKQLNVSDLDNIISRFIKETYGDDQQYQGFSLEAIKQLKGLMRSDNNSDTEGFVDAIYSSGKPCEKFGITWQGLESAPMPHEQLTNKQ